MATDPYFYGREFARRTELAQAETEIVWDPWQPIETAPKDGTTLLLFCDEGGDRYLGFRPIDCPDDAAATTFNTACYPALWCHIPDAPEFDEDEGDTSDYRREHDRHDLER